MCKIGVHVMLLRWFVVRVGSLSLGFQGCFRHDLDLVTDSLISLRSRF